MFRPAHCFLFSSFSQEREREKRTPLFPLHCHIPSNGLATSYGSSIFSFKRHHRTVFFCSGCINLHPCLQCTWVPFCPNPSQLLSFLSFLMTAVLTGARWRLSRFWFAFPWWLALLNILSCVCWPQHFLFEKYLFSAAHVLVELFVCFFDVELYELFIYVEH